MEAKRNEGRIVRGKPVFTIIPSVLARESFMQEDRPNLRKDVAYTPVSRNKFNSGLLHLRVYRSSTSAFSGRPKSGNS